MKAGDDLTEIAARFGTTIGELETLNKLTSDEILASRTLVVDATVGTSIDADTAARTDPLPSWNDGPAKQAILKFVKTTTDRSSPEFVPPAERIATFDQDGTLWVEHPIYSFVMYALESVVHGSRLPADDGGAGTVIRRTSSPAAARTSCGCIPRACDGGGCQGTDRAGL